MKIQNILSEKGTVLYTVGPANTIQEAIDLLVKHNIGALLVMDGASLAGIITERDILKECARDAGHLGVRRVGDLMTRELVICQPGDEVEEAMATMTQKHCRHLPIIQDERVVGMISIGDLVKSQMTDFQHELKYMRDYITGARL